MASRENKGAIMHEKLQLLRSIVNSHAESNRSIIGDASKYIKELKDKVERLNQEMTSTSNSTFQPSSLPEVTVEATKKGVLVNVNADGNCPGLLVTVLEAFEELNLNVVEARVSCSDSFRFEATGGENEEQCESIDVRVVRQAILQAIRNWMTKNGGQQD